MKPAPCPNGCGELDAPDADGIQYCRCGYFTPHVLSITPRTRRSRTGKCSCGAWEKSNGTTREIQAAHRVHVRAAWKENA